MSLHLNRQCQRADAHPPPVRLVPGIGCTDQEEARTNTKPQGGRVRLLRAHIWVAPRCVNRLFCNIVAVCRMMRLGTPSPAPLAWTLDGASEGSVQGIKPFRSRGVFRRSGYRCASPRPRLRSVPCGASRGRRSRRCREYARPRPPASGESAAGSSAPAPKALQCPARR